MNRVLLGDVAEIIKGISYRSADYSDSENGTAFVNLKSVARGGGYNPDGIKYYVGQIKPSQYVKSGDILIANTDLTQNREIIGSPIIMPDMGRSACFSLDLSKIIVTDTDMVYPRYLFYYLKSPIVREYMLAHSNGSTVMHLSVKAVPNMEINLPPLDQQKKIANILGSLDEKIELNRRMNETLEQLGQALFRHYFVDNPEVKNWSIVKVGDVLSELQSGSRPRGGAVKSGVPSVGAENIVGLGKYDYSKEKYISEEFFNRLGRGVVNSGDVLLYKDGAYVGKKSLFMNGFPHKKCAINEHVFILRTNSRLKSQFFLYFWLDQPSITKKIIDAGVKAAQPGINQSNVNSLPILLPPEESVKKFDNEISPIMGMIFSNAIESNQLAALRDLLLQKLISGEIEV